MVTSVETLRRELERLKEERKKLRVLHQRIPKDLERRIVSIEYQLTMSPFFHGDDRLGNPVKHTIGATLWEVRYILGGLVFLGAAAIIYVYY